jgi:hypothetical protein
LTFTSPDKTKLKPLKKEEHCGRQSKGTRETKKMKKTQISLVTNNTRPKKTLEIF